MRVALLGDIAPVGKRSIDSNPDLADSLSWLAGKARTHDLVIANLESPLTDRRTSFVPKSMHIRANPANVELLSDLGVNAVSLANNHIWDYGRKGVEQTIEVLELAGIQWFGLGGKRLEIRGADTVLSVGGYACLTTNGAAIGARGRHGVNMLTRAALEDQLHSDASAGRTSILSVHMGREHSSLPNPEHLTLFRRLADEHRFVLHGHHPHVLQGVETRGESLLAYSLGNALFGELVSLNGKKKVPVLPDNEKSVLLSVDFSNIGRPTYKLIGFRSSQQGIVGSTEAEADVARYTEALADVTDLGAYTRLRDDQFNKAIAAKFGARNLGWLAARLNYHDVFSRLIAELRASRYKQIRLDFEHVDAAPQEHPPN